ncbi:MAG: methyltransferase domain-containing protein [Sphingobacteriales bacterium]|nr:MAG: methyltransferase domain-containing protein [Sphingobacteriales bacterium]
MKFTQRSYEKELLDGTGIPFAAIERNMKELNTINTLLGGHAITIKGFRQLATGNHCHICEIGCGGGDNLLAIAKSSKAPLHITGIDLNAACIQVAATTLKNYQPVLLVSNYKNVEWKTDVPDIVFSSLFCHHFTDEEMVSQLQWMQQHCSKGFFINDLHRHWLAYYSIKWLTALFSKSYLVKNDAPLSVRRGFRRNEWKELLEQAGIKNYAIQWKWAFRWLIIVHK